jgi:hypothetical protein
MTHDERHTRRTVPKPPELDPLDLDWTDEEPNTEPHSPFSEDPSHRVTVVPAMPPEKLAKQLMALADAEEDADPLDRPTPVIALEPFLASEAVPSRTLEPTVRAPVGGAPVLELDDPYSVEVQYSYESIPPEELFPPEHETTPDAVPSPVELALREMRDRHAVGDFSGSLNAAETVLASLPDHVEAQRFAENCRVTLTDMLTARVGRLDRCPSVVVPPDQIRWLSLDHHAGFLLSLIDGNSTLEEVLDMSGMARLDALRIVCDLLEQKVLALRPRR